MIKGRENEKDRIRGNGLLLDDRCCPDGRRDDDFRRLLIESFGSVSLKGKLGKKRFFVVNPVNAAAGYGCGTFGIRKAFYGSHW